MKNLNTETSVSCIKLVDENEKLVGEILFEVILHFKERLKINNEIFKIRSAGFFSNDIKVFDVNGNVVAESDISKERIIHFGEHKEIYRYKQGKLFSNELFLYKNDELISSVNTKGIFSKEYKMEVKEDFDNYLVILTFLSFFIRSL